MLLGEKALFSVVRLYSFILLYVQSTISCFNLVFHSSCACKIRKREIGMYVFVPFYVCELFTGSTVSCFNLVFHSICAGMELVKYET